jgi:hypothetical protein
MKGIAEQSSLVKIVGSEKRLGTSSKEMGVLPPLSAS